VRRFARSLLSSASTATPAALEDERVTRRHHQRVNVDLDQADELHAAGLSITEVARAMGIGRTTLKARRAARE
jgi:hypothetical protein